MVDYDAIPGLSTMHFTAWIAIGASKIADPEQGETTVAEWRPVAEVTKLIADGGIQDGPSLTALTSFLSLHPFGGRRLVPDAHRGHSTARVDRPWLSEGQHPDPPYRCLRRYLRQRYLRRLVTNLRTGIKDGRCAPAARIAR
jgi:hypothetical protein